MSIPGSSLTFLRRLAWVLGGLYALWLLVGFLLVPRIIQGRLERMAQDLLHRQVTLQKVSFNPIILTARAEGLRIANRDGSDWITLQSLALDYRFHRLFSHSVELAAVEIQGLAVRVSLDEQGRTNFQDLLDEPSAAPKATTKEAPSAWDFAIDRFDLVAGQLHFEDRSQGSPFRTTVGPLSLHVNDLRTRLGQHSDFAFEAWTEAKEHLSLKGGGSFQPLATTATLLVENISLPKYRSYLREQVVTEFRSGTASLSAQIQLAWSPGQHVVELSQLGLSLKDLKLAEPGVAEAAFELPSLELKDGRLNLLAPSLELGSIRASQGILRVQRDKQGGLNLARLFAPTKPKAKKPDDKPFKLLVRDLILQGFRVGFEDLGPARPLKTEVTDLNLRWQGFTLDPAGTSRAALDLHLGQGSLKVEGDIAPLQPTLDLKILAEGLEIAPWDPYLDATLDLRVATGKLGLDGRLRYGPGGLKYQGGASVQVLEVQDVFAREPFLRWKQLKVSGADLRTAPLAVTIKAVDWISPEGRLVVGLDGRTNVAQALRLAPSANQSDKPAPVSASALPATPTTAPDLFIQKLAISGGRLSFIDRSLQPNAALVLADLEGSYLGITSRPDVASKVDFTGKAGGLAPITITGHAMPLRNDLDTDVALKIQGADLTDFSPYTGKYLGYTVQKGKLNVDARLRIDHRQLKAENAVQLDQFYLGDKVQSPVATGLPVKLGLAILRDRKGVIAFDLPIQGSLDDPDVKYGQLVWKAVFGLLGKIATSPFALIGNLFGSDAGDLSSVAFAPGSSSLDAAATAKLQSLAKALVKRPALSLEAEGTMDVDQDGAALRKAALETLLAQTRAQALKLAEPSPVPLAERERWLRVAFAATFPAVPEPKGTKPTPPPPPAELEQRLLSNLKMDPADLDALADARTKAVIAWLLNTAKADPARVFEVQTGKAKGAVVAFSLK